MEPSNRDLPLDLLGRVLGSNDNSPRAYDYGWQWKPPFILHKLKTIHVAFDVLHSNEVELQDLRASVADRL